MVRAFIRAVAVLFVGGPLLAQTATTTLRMTVAQSVPLAALKPVAKALKGPATCRTMSTSPNGGRVMAYSITADSNHRSTYTITLDSAGRPVRFSEMYGELRMPSPVGRSLQEAVAARDSFSTATRTTNVMLDFVMGEALVTNRGGGMADSTGRRSIRELDGIAAFDLPLERLQVALKACLGNRSPSVEASKALTTTAAVSALVPREATPQAVFAAYVAAMQSKNWRGAAMLYDADRAAEKASQNLMNIRFWVRAGRTMTGGFSSTPDAEINPQTRTSPYDTAHFAGLIDTTITLAGIAALTATDQLALGMAVQLYRSAAPLAPVMLGTVIEGDSVAHLVVRQPSFYVVSSPFAPPPISMNTSMVHFRKTAVGWRMLDGGGQWTSYDIANALRYAQMRAETQTRTQSQLVGLLPMNEPRPANACKVPAQPVFEFQVDSPATWIRDVSQSPKPAPGAPGATTLVQFVVDTLGVPDPRTLKILKDDGGLGAKAKDVFEKWRFTPAKRADGCKVSQLVQTPILP